MYKHILGLPPKLSLRALLGQLSSIMNLNLSSAPTEPGSLRRLWSPHHSATPWESIYLCIGYLYWGRVNRGTSKRLTGSNSLYPPWHGPWDILEDHCDNVRSFTKGKTAEGPESLRKGALQVTSSLQLKPESRSFKNLVARWNSSSPDVASDTSNIYYRMKLPSTEFGISITDTRSQKSVSSSSWNQYKAAGSGQSRMHGESARRSVQALSARQG
ncbi:hypothetical protein C8Q80DRAFT_915465 [Daedaleopsis nitida]|nr:hypothetical protein C8Q80DRAFT_915465 [Daedaleopsis nitida]